MCANGLLVLLPLLLFPLPLPLLLPVLLSLLLPLPVPLPSRANLRCGCCNSRGVCGRRDTD